MFIYCDIFPDVQIMQILSLGITLTTGTTKLQTARLDLATLVQGSDLNPAASWASLRQPPMGAGDGGIARASLLLLPERPVLLHYYMTAKVSTMTPKQRPLLACKVITLGHLREMLIYIGLCTYCMMWTASFCLHCRRKCTFTITYLQTVTVISSSFYT